MSEYSESIDHETETNTQVPPRLGKKSKGNVVERVQISKVGMIKKYSDEANKILYKNTVKDYFSANQSEEEDRNQDDLKYIQQYQSKLKQTVYSNPIFGATKGQNQLHKIIRQQLPFKCRLQPSVTNLLRDFSKVFVHELIEESVSVMQKNGYDHELSCETVRQGYYNLKKKAEKNSLI